jgi:hypothetical protein
MAPATSKSAAEQFSLWGAVVVVILGILIASEWSALVWLAVLAGLACLAVHFQPRFAPAMKLPGSRGSLLVLTGGIAAICIILEIVQWIGWILEHLVSLDTVQIIVMLVASLAMAWGGWLVLGMEGGKFQIGLTASVGGAGTSGMANASASPAMPSTASGPSGPAMASGPEMTSSAEMPGSPAMAGSAEMPGSQDKPA